MGRLKQEKVRKILALAKQNYTQGEIAAQVECTPKTVAKYIKFYGQKEEVAPTPPPSGVEVLAKILLELFGALAVSPYLDGNAVEEWSDDLARKLLQDLDRADKGLAKRVISNNQFIKQLQEMQILDLKIPEETLSELDRKRREKWVKMLKAHYPEKLSDLV